MERDKIRHSKKMTMVFGNHGPKDLGNLDIFHGAIDDTLAATTHGKVALVVEDADRNAGASMDVTSLVARGWKPSDALVSTYLDFNRSLKKIPRSKRIATPKHVQAWRASRPDAIADPFTSQQYEMLDALFADQAARDRLLLVPEGNPVWLSGRTVPEWANKQITAAVNVFIKDKKFDLRTFGSALNGLREHNEAREKGLEKIIFQTLAQPEVGGVVSYMGPTHSEASDQFLSYRTGTKRIFADKEKGVYVFDPIEALIKGREVAHDYHDVYTDTELKVGLSRTIVHRLMSRIAQWNGEHTEQQVRRRVWAGTRDMTARDAQDFLENTRVAGVRASIKALFDVQEHKDAQRKNQPIHLVRDSMDRPPPPVTAANVGVGLEDLPDGGELIDMAAMRERLKNRDGGPPRRPRRGK